LNPVFHSVTTGERGALSSWIKQLELDAERSVYLMLRLRISGDILHSPMYLNAVQRNKFFCCARLLIYEKKIQ
jgi:hypothetical protein